VSDPGPVADPRDSRIAELEQRIAAYNGVIERIKPYEEDLSILDSDEDYREFAREARKTYIEQREARKKAAEPKLDPAAQSLVDAFYERVKPSLEFVDKLRERETPEYAAQQQAESAKQEFIRQNEQYAQRLVAEHGLSQEDVLDVVAYANALHERGGRQKFVGLEEAWKKMTSRGAAATPAATTRSLRSHSATPGIPAGSKPAEPDRADIARPGGLTSHMLRKLNKKGA
jgi:hypothetical protein